MSSSSQIYMMRISARVLPCGVVDDRLEVDALLQDVIAALVSGDGHDFFARRADAHAQAGKREERLQHIVMRVLRDVMELVEEPGLGHRGMPQVRNGKLADAEIVVGVSGPFDIQFVAEIEGRRNATALQLVDDGAVINAVNRDLAAVALVEEALAVFA